MRGHIGSIKRNHLEDNGLMLRTINVLGLFAVILFLVLIVGCSSKIDYNGTLICREFYNLNKNKDFSHLNNLRILDTREYSVYDKKNGKNNRIPISILIIKNLSDTIVLPSYQPKADVSERKIFFNRCDSTALRYIREKYQLDPREDIMFKYYQTEIDCIYREYCKIELPKSLPYNNIPVISHAGYLEFLLYKNNKQQVYYKCYLIQDSLLMSNYERERILNLPNYDNYWYYSIVE